MSDARLRTLAAGLLLAAAAAGCHQLDFSPRHAAGEIDIYDDLFSVSVPDPLHAVAVGYHGSIYYTQDGGGTWSKGHTPNNRLLYSVSMADAQHGWAVGQLGTILRTEDGGASWAEQPNLKADEGSHLFGVQAIDVQTAWVVGEWGTRIVTRDGGRSWEDHSLTISLDHPMFVWLGVSDQENVRKGKKVYEDVGLNDVTCLPRPSRDCWMIGEFGYIFHSEDAGETWIRGEILGDVRMDPIEFEYNVLEITDQDRERLTAFAKLIEDQAHLNILIDPFASAKEVADFSRPGDPDELFDILGARIDEVKAVIEEAGIMSDRLRMPNKPPWDWEDFEEDDPTFVQRYIDGRLADRSYVRVGVIQNPYLFTIRFQDEKIGYIAGLGGVILKTEDGGHTWTYLETGRKQAFYSLAALEERTIAVGEKGLVRLSEDGGLSWREPQDGAFPTVFTFMRDMDFEHNRNVGFVVGQEGMVLRTTDGGRRWARVLPPPDEVPTEG
jgi:photosystem II stability/assembly factor-like uncharacterized protein